MASSPELFSLAMGSLVAEQFPGFVNVSHFRFVFSVSQADCCYKLWGSSSVTVLSIHVTAQCHILFAQSKCSKTAAIASQAHTDFQVSDKCISTPPTPLNCQARFTQHSTELQLFLKTSLRSTWNTANRSMSKTSRASSVSSPIRCEEMLRKSSFAIVIPNGLPSIFTSIY